MRASEEHERKTGGGRGDSYLSAKLEVLRDVAAALIEEVKAAEILKISDSHSGINLQHNIDLHEEMSRYETYLIMLALDRAGGVQRRAAQLLGVKETTLHSKIKRYQIASRKSSGGAYAPAATKP